MCPGGRRAWSLPGYYNALESSSDVRPCMLPDATSKCTGWSTALRATRCGQGYRQGSFLCGACEPGYYLEGDGSCNACPIVVTLWDRYQRLFALFASVIGFVALVYAALTFFVWFRGSRERVHVPDILTFLILLLTSLQVLSGVNNVGSMRLPPSLRWLYDIVGLLQLQGITLPPSCIPETYFFGLEVSIMAVGLSLWAVVIIVASATQCFAQALKYVEYLEPIGRLSLIAAVYMHPTIAETAFRLISCSSIVVSESSLNVLDGGSGSVHVGQNKNLVSVSVLKSNPYFICLQGQHTRAGYMAIAATVAFVFGLPALTLWWVWHDPWLSERLRSHTVVVTPGGQCPPLPCARFVRGAVCGSSFCSRSSLRVTSTQQPAGIKRPARKNAMLSPFLEGEYRTYAWFMRHVDMSVITGIIALDAAIPLPVGISEIAGKLAGTLALLAMLFVTLLLIPNPYHEDWTIAVRFALILLSASCASIDAAARALDVGIDSPTLAASIVPGAYCILAGFCLIVAALLVGLVRDILRRTSERAHLVMAEVPTLTAPSFKPARSAIPRAARKLQRVANSRSLSTGEGAVQISVRASDARRVSVPGYANPSPTLVAPGVPQQSSQPRGVCSDEVTSSNSNTGKSSSHDDAANVVTAIPCNLQPQQDEAPICPPSCSVTGNTGASAPLFIRLGVVELNDESRAPSPVSRRPSIVRPAVEIVSLPLQLSRESTPCLRGLDESGTLSIAPAQRPPASSTRLSKGGRFVYPPAAYPVDSSGNTNASESGNFPGSQHLVLNIASSIRSPASSILISPTAKRMPRRFSIGAASPVSPPPSLMSPTNAVRTKSTYFAHGSSASLLSVGLSLPDWVDDSSRKAAVAVTDHVPELASAASHAALRIPRSMPASGAAPLEPPLECSQRRSGSSIPATPSAAYYLEGQAVAGSTKRSSVGIATSVVAVPASFPAWAAAVGANGVKHSRSSLSLTGAVSAVVPTGYNFSVVTPLAAAAATPASSLRGRRMSY